MAFWHQFQLILEMFLAKSSMFGTFLQPFWICVHKCFSGSPVFSIMTAESSQRWSCGTLQDGVEQMDLDLREQEMMLALQA